MRKIFAVCVVVILSFTGAVSTAIARGQVTTKSTVWSTPDFLFGEEIDGALSKIVRTYAGISVQLRTHELMPGDSYSLLIAVFNFPEECTGDFEGPVDPPPSCTSDDLFNSDVAADIMFVAGNVVGESGRGAFAGHIAIGDNSGSIMSPLYPEGVQPPGLLNPMGAEFHILLFSHGSMIPEFMPGMIHTFAGGCAAPPVPFDGLDLLEPPVLGEWGEPGPNYCMLHQEAFDLAPTP